jgi:hypothetical protein
LDASSVFTVTLYPLPLFGQTDRDLPFAAPHVLNAARVKETAVQKAERVVKEEMERLGWDEDALRGAPHGARGEGPAGAAPASANHHEFEMDRPAPAHRQLDLRS